MYALHTLQGLKPEQLSDIPGGTEESFMTFISVKSTQQEE